VAGAVLVLALLFLRVGGEPFLDGVRAVDPASVLVVVALTALSTLAAAWRWQGLARSLGDPVRLPAAVAAYYRSQFLNSVLPGGVVGDVHRGIARGRDRADVRGSLLAVAWDRVLGQAVQVLITGGVLLLTAWAPPEALVVLLLGVAVVVGLLVVLGAISSERARGRRLGPVIPRALVASVVTTGGRAAGVSATPAVLLPLALLVLVAAAVPLSVAGWGVREGAAAWLFAAAGLGAGAGVTVATAYGAMALVAVLPGAAVLVLDRSRAPHGREAR
jgi:hypothetical protein